MINIGPSYIWDIVIFSILIFGLICGIFVRTAASLYFLAGNIIVLGLFAAFKQPVIQAVAHNLERGLERFISSDEIKTTIPIFATFISEFALFIGLFILLNMVLFSVYSTFLRLPFKLLKFNSIYDRLAGAIISMISVGIFAFMLSSVVSSSLFYTTDNFSFNQPVFTQSNPQKQDNEYQTSSGSAAIFSVLPETNLHKKGNSIAYLFWFAMDINNKKDNIEDIVDIITKPNEFIPNLKNAIDNVSEEQKHKIINKMLEPLVNAIEEKIKTDQPKEQVDWSAINEAFKKWQTNNGGKQISGEAITEMMNSDDPEYKVFKDLKEILDKNKDDNVAKMINSGDKLYGIFKNFYGLNTLVDSSVSSLDKLNGYVEQYISGIVISKPHNSDAAKVESYEQFKQWFS